MRRIIQSGMLSRRKSAAASPHVWWCERERLAAAPYSINVTRDLYRIMMSKSDMNVALHFNYERRAFSHFAFRFDRPAMRVDELFGDCQSQPAMSAFTARFVATPEAVKDEGEVFGRDA